MEASQLLRNYRKVEEEISEACVRSGRKRSDVRLVAVSKFHSTAEMTVIARAGQLDFGENYVQEAAGKMAELNSANGFGNLRWHMIGHVQSRKAPQVAGNYVLLHTLDSRKLAEAMERSLARADKIQDALIEVNIGGEPQKAGVSAENLQELGEFTLKNCPHINLRGLMCLPPVFDSGDAARPFFGKLRILRDGLERGLGMDLPELSMGMSGDFAGAIAEGATIVRIGTEIFGPRPPKTASGIARQG